MAMLNPSPEVQWSGQREQVISHYLVYLCEGQLSPRSAHLPLHKLLFVSINWQFKGHRTKERLCIEGLNN